MAGLTLALAVHQQQAIAIDTRERILFLMSGVVLLTLLINGTTTNLLLNYLGKDHNRCFLHWPISRSRSQSIPPPLADLTMTVTIGASSGGWLVP
jgi:hypothetical protein